MRGVAGRRNETEGKDDKLSNENPPWHKLSFLTIFPGESDQDATSDMSDRKGIVFLFPDPRFPTCVVSTFAIWEYSVSETRYLPPSPSERDIAG